MIPNAGSTYWCRDSEVLETSDGFVFCPSRDKILLRVSEEDISPVQNLPVPGTYYMFIFKGSTPIQLWQVNNNIDVHINAMKKNNSLLPTNKKCCCLTENIAVTNTSAQELLGGSGSGAIDISANISVLEGMLK